MALSPAEKQRRYRQRIAARASVRPASPASTEPPERHPDCTTEDVLPAALSATNSRDVCAATVAYLRIELHRLAYANAGTSRDRATVATALTSATRLHARLLGALDVSKSQIVRSRHWAEIAAAMVEALKSYPEAAAAVDAAIARLENP